MLQSMSFHNQQINGILLWLTESCDQSINIILNISITQKINCLIPSHCAHKKYKNILPQMPINGVPKSFSKALFISMPLGAAIKRMISSKAVPVGLKPQECERSPGWNKPPILYIPEKDTIEDTSSDCTLKIMLPNKWNLGWPCLTKLPLSSS